MNIMLVNTVFMHRHDLMNLIIIASVLITGGIIAICRRSIVRNQEKYLQLLEWCRNIYDLDQYHTLIRVKAMKKLSKTQKFCNTIINVIFVGLISDILLITIGIALISKFLPDEIYPKYQPPVPIYLPFFEEKKLIDYLINLSIQSCGALITAQSFAYLLNIFLTVSIHILTYLDLIYETIVQMKKVLSLNEPGGVCVGLDVKEWTKMICDMVSDFKQ